MDWSLLVSFARPRVRQGLHFVANRDFSRSVLRLSASSLDWALNHAMKYGDTDVFPRPFEFDALQFDWVSVRDYLAGNNILDWTTRPQRSLLSPKARYAFRAVTQLDPLDFIVFAATLREMGSELESKRIPVRENIVFSYRFAPTKDGGLFNPKLGYNQYQQQSDYLFNTEQYSHVVVADIADFYSRIYVHRLENSLNNATSKRNHVLAIKKFISGWNGTESYGIPVGNAPSRLLAEITISDIDDLLRAYGFTFVRFNDDYRLFAKTKSEAYRMLTLLADHLYTNHGLSLQPQKTAIVDIEEFARRYLPSPEDRELESFRHTLHDLIEQLGLDTDYDQIKYEDLTADQKAKIDEMNLVALLRSELAQADCADNGVLRFLLRRLSQLENEEIVSDLLTNIEVLHPVFPDVIRYLQSLRHSSVQLRHDIGAMVISLVQNSFMSEMPFHRMWALTLFTESNEWDNEGKFLLLLSSLTDPFSRRKLILALGRCGRTGWFQSRWRALFQEEHWCRRALIAAASCMPSDARKHWYDSIEPQLDILEKAVVKWVRQKPFANR